VGYDTCLLKPANEAQRLAALLELDLLETRRFPELDRLTALAADVCGAEISVITLHTFDEGIQISSSTGGSSTRHRAPGRHLLYAHIAEAANAGHHGRGF